MSSPSYYRQPAGRRRRKPLPDMPVQLVDLSASHGEHFISVPGVLTRSHEQLRPLMPALTSMLVSGVDYLGPHFSADSAVEKLALLVKSNVDMAQQTILFGSSLGGMIVAKTLAVLRSDVGPDRLNEFVRTIIVDAPQGGRDLILAPFLPAGFTPAAAAMFRWLRPGEGANSGYGRRLLSTFKVPPKDREIEVAAGGPSVEEIKSLAIAGLEGHMFTMWFEQVRWMLNIQLDLTALRGLNVTYLACVHGNVTVRQPQALQTWAPYVRQVGEVNTPHCAYLQAATTWNEILDGLLSP